MRYLDNNNIIISKEVREKMISSIKEYFYKERDEDLGDLSSSLILDFIIEELGPEFYNQGVLDAHKFMNEKIEDLFGIQIYKR